MDLDAARSGKAVVLKTSTRQTIFLPVIGLVEPSKLKPGDLVGVNKDRRGPPLSPPAAAVSLSERQPRALADVPRSLHPAGAAAPPRADAPSPPPPAAVVFHPALTPPLLAPSRRSYLILDTLPAEYDARVKAMEVDEKPTEDYSDIGGLDKQIQELARPRASSALPWGLHTCCEIYK